jgi:sortase A
MKRIILRFLSIIFAIVGISILAYVVFPIASYEILNFSRFSQYLSPVPEEEIPFDSASLDSTKASSWFVGGAEPANFVTPNISFYTLSIPKLRIDEATVSIGGEDLEKSLIQYPGTALPGKRGNAAIFGHSILPQFYNPKDYLTIFSTLPTLKKGDEVTVRYDGIVYNYRVEDMFEVKPTDLQVLEQNTSDSFLTLVTCVPPGDPRRPKRLIVRARLERPLE